jgi:hypothetical protein
MTEGNGKTDNMMTPPSEYVEFVIGGQPVRVKVLTLWDLDLIRDIFLSMDSSNWITYSRQVIQMVSILVSSDHPELTPEFLSRNCTATEARNLTPTFAELLEKSGLILPGEATAAMETESSGTGTQTPSPPNSPSEESAAGTQL